MHVIYLVHLFCSLLFFVKTQSTHQSSAEKNAVKNLSKKIHDIAQNSLKSEKMQVSYHTVFYVFFLKNQQILSEAGCS